MTTKNAQLLRKTRSVTNRKWPSATSTGVQWRGDLGEVGRAPT